MCRGWSWTSRSTSSPDLRLLGGGPTLIRFDSAALYRALDERRRSRGESWRQVAAEVGVSAATITRLRAGGRLEVDGMLALVSWLGATVESFTRESPR